MRPGHLACLCVFVAVLALASDLCRASEEEQIAEYESGYYYTVKKGDTLWDLSERFSDSPWQWPDLWHYNVEVTDPHVIFPGQLLRVFRKKASGRVEMGTPPEKTDTDTDTDTDMDEEWADETIPMEGDFHFNYPSIDGVGFVRKERLKPNGAIFRAEDDKELISQGDVVYVRPERRHQFSVGEKYTVCRTLRPPEEKSRWWSLGTQYLLTGVVEIAQVESRFVKGRITKSFRDIAIHDMVIPYRRRPKMVPIVDSVAGVEGRLAFSEEHADLIGKGFVAFIDKGEEDGFKPGQLYSVYKQERTQIDPPRLKSILLDPIDIGEVLVLHSEPTTSTVLVTQSEEVIYPGTPIRSPSR